MKNKNTTQFLIWLRNGVCFCMTWFLLLFILLSGVFHYEAITITTLGKLLLLTIGGVCLFNIFFLKILIKKWSFIQRLTAFMLAFCVYECLGFYWLGLFTSAGSAMQWIIFSGIVLGLYLISILINYIYGKKRGKAYAEALKTYQRSRNGEIHYASDNMQDANNVLIKD